MISTESAIEKMTPSGLIEEQHRQEVSKGWGHMHALLPKRAEAHGPFAAGGGKKQ
jgi:hypothetical protein